MKKILAMALSVILVATLAISGTVAYLTDDESAVNVMTVGKVDIVLHEDQRSADGSSLVDFVQNKNLMPINGSAQDRPHDDWGMPSEAMAKNYVDKIVRVENTGESPAYIRIFVAVPAALEGASASENVLHWNLGNDFNNAKAGGSEYGLDFENDGKVWEMVTTTPIVIKENDSDPDVKYNVYSFTVDRIVPADQGAASMTAAPFVGFYLDSKVDYDDHTEAYYLGKKVEENRITVEGIGVPGAASYDFDNGIKIPVFAQAVQAEGFATAEDAFTAAFGANYNPWADSKMETDMVLPDSVSSNEELKDALTEDKENIVVNLTSDANYDIAAWNANGMGGATTKTITINGNGNTLNFYQSNSDWNNIVTTNNAKLILNNVNITRTKNGGNNAWNNYSTMFNCPVEMNNVNISNAIVLHQDAKLNSVTINEAGEYYGLYITAEGQNVEINDLKITATNSGRGIKVIDEYISSPEMINLKVTKATFKTAKKAAVLVTSTAGANITLSNIDISGVAADTTNAVWVDTARASYSDLVTVTGGSKIIEP